jgi:hypothetical protein
MPESLAIKTVVQHIGHSEEDNSLDVLFKMLADHPLERSFAAYGDYLEPPVWNDPSAVGWAPDGSDGEFMFWGNFHDYSFGFNLTTNDPVLLDRLRLAVEANCARPDFQAQPSPELSLGLLADYVRDLGIGSPRWESDTEMPERAILLLLAVDDDELVECQLQHEGAVVDYICNRRALKAELLRLCRTRRPELGYSLADILGSIADPQPGTLVAAISGHAIVDRDIKPGNATGQLDLL